MPEKPSHEELEKRIKELEKEASEYRHVEEKLAWRASFPDQNPNPIIEIEAENRVTYLNPAAKTRFPDLPKTALQHPILKDLPSIMAPLKGGKLESITREVEVNDSVYEQKIVYAPGKNRTRVFNLDISRSRYAEEKLRESEERYRGMINAAADGIVIHDEKAVILNINPACSKMFGYPDSEIIGKKSKVFIHPKHLHGFHYYSRQVEETGKAHLETVCLRKDGSSFPVEIHGACFTRGKRRAYLAIVRDITERKRAEEEKSRLEIRLQQRQRMEAISALAGGIAHDFNNALAAITGNIELLKLDFPHDDKITQYTERINASTERMAGLTDQLLAYAEGGKYQPTLISLSNFVKDSLSLILRSIDPVIRVDTDLQDDISTIEGDYNQMQMALSAVITNAIEAIEGPGHIRIMTRDEEIDDEFSKTHPGFRSGSYVCLTVEDDGKGMDDETKTRIFDPFFTTKLYGRGLGMAAVHGILRNHNGCILVDSKQGRGSVVRIYLPSKKEIEKPGRKPGKVSKTVLLIEDEGMILDVYRELFEYLGYRVLPARTGVEAVNITRTFDGDIDLAMLDIGLPDLRGDGLYPLIKEARPNMKVIVCSGYSIDGPVQKILDEGAQDFIRKPFTLATLAEKLKKVLEKE
ncbi:MAG: PAS domain S-box protein [Thermodesulfobacteriota bacterium]|nr:PAS domain S-box protein [Thermodesulfobacteriota bacterium]